MTEALMRHPTPWHAVHRSNDATCIIDAFNRTIFVGVEPELADYVVEVMNYSVPGGRSPF